jgi:hypothetical protein
VLTPALIARFFSSNFSLQINHLADRDEFVKAPSPVSARAGAPVEFQARAVAGAGRD